MCQVSLLSLLNAAENPNNGLLGGCGTFYQIIIASDAFKGVSTVKQHRMVNEVLKQEIEGIHGLQVGSIGCFLCNCLLSICTS